MARIPADTRREQFIDAAVRVIARDGVVGATTRRIAEEANAPQTSLHYCFQAKENLLLAVFEHLSESLRADSEAVADKETMSLPDNSVRGRTSSVCRVVSRMFDGSSGKSAFGQHESPGVPGGLPEQASVSARKPGWDPYRLTGAMFFTNIGRGCRCKVETALDLQEAGREPS
ncbi:TetR/AcrR family transcriptional regulator [Streptomyces viridiviolaceus]